MLLTSLSSVKCWDFFLCPTFETKSVNKSYFRCDSAWVTYYVFYFILRNVSFTTKWNKSHFTSAKIYRIKCIFSLWTSIIDNIRLPTFHNCSWYKLLVRIKLIEIWTRTYRNDGKYLEALPSRFVTFSNAEYDKKKERKKTLCEIGIVLMSKIGV